MILGVLGAALPGIAALLVARRLDRNRREWLVTLPVAAGVCLGLSSIVFWVWLTAAAILAVPMYLTATTEQFADVPLAFYMLATLVSVDRAAESGRLAWWLAAGAAAGCAAWTKNEGQLFFALSLAATIVWMWRSPAGSRRGAIMAFCLGALPAIAAVASLRLVLPAPHELFTGLSWAQLGARLHSSSRWLAISTALGRQLWFGGATVVGALPLTCGFAIAMGPARPMRPAAALGAAVVVLMLLGDTAVYLFTSQRLAIHLSTSADRVVVQLVPAAIWAMMMAAGQMVPTRDSGAQPGARHRRRSTPVP